MSELDPDNKRIPPILFIVAAAILFSTGGLFIKLSTLSAFELACGRSLFAVAIVALVTRREGFGLNRITAVASILYALLLLLFVVATKWTTAANAIFLQFTAPVYVLLLEPLFYGEKFRARDFLTVAACIGGMSLFFIDELNPTAWSGNLLALLSGVCFGVFMLLLRHPRARETNRASPVIYGNLLLIVITAPAFFGAMNNVSGREWMIISYLGVIQIGVAYMFFTLGFARGVRSLDAGIAGYIEPVLNPVWVAAVYGERPGKWAIAGGAIIIAAVVLHTIFGKARRVSKIET